MAIKASLGKLVLVKPLGELLPVLLADSGIELLPIEVPDVARVAALPFHHRDPFDRKRYLTHRTVPTLNSSCTIPFENRTVQ
jgi:PIN domain nuclease of toxin-antitoxin system